VEHASPAILARCRAPQDDCLVRVTRARLAAAGRGLPPFAIAPSRCNRCGACLRLGCPAILDAGGEALLVDGSACTGCSACASACRARALAPVPWRPML
jgi:indolepyruvate ferredoxin oxidoreductase alpha subunit